MTTLTLSTRSHYAVTFRVRTSRGWSKAIFAISILPNLADLAGCVAPAAASWDAVAYLEAVLSGEIPDGDEPWTVKLLTFAVETH
jgi:hypothetical protein